MWTMTAITFSILAAAVIAQLMAYHCIFFTLVVYLYKNSVDTSDTRE